MRTLLLILLLNSGSALAQGALEVIPLKYRTAEQVLPILRPLLEPGGALTGQYNQLIVRTSERNLADIRTALEAIDTPLRRLLISVRHDASADASREALEARGSIPGRMEIRGADTRATREERVDQRIQVIEGGRAFISAGEARPLGQRQVVRTPGGTVITESTVIQEAATGFEVTPRLSGSRVVLEIAPQRETFAPGGRGAIPAQRAVNTQRAGTSVSGRIGEWIELGGATESATRGERGILSTRELRSSGSRRIWVKVEEVRP